MNNDMPPLPPKVVTDRHIPTGIALYGYTDSMVRAYAREYANSQVREVVEALVSLVREFPTDVDMEAAGWNSLNIEQACSAYDRARAILAKHKTTTTQTEG